MKSLYRSVWAALLTIVLAAGAVSIAGAILAGGQGPAAKAQTQPATLPGCWVQAIDPANSFRNLELKGVSAVGADDVWAVGSYTPENSGSKTFTMHWNGKQWSVVSSPSPGNIANGLTGV